MFPTLRIEEVPVALLAGGLATRLGPISRQTPKAMVEVAGRPFVAHQLLLLHRHGIRRAVLCLGHLGQQIEQYLGDGSAFDIHLEYSHDGAALVGTGGALRQALPMLGKVFWVMYGDSYMDIDYSAILQHFAQSGGSPVPLGLMTVIKNEDRWDRSNAVFADGRLQCYDKRNRSAAMHHIDYGVQLLRRKAIESIAAGQPCDLSDVYHQLVGRGEMIGYEVSQRFYEIGTPGSLEETRRYLETPATAIR